MELSKKTTILRSRDLHDRLPRLPELRGTSLGGLIREACQAQYGLVPLEERLESVEALSRLGLPVGPVERLKRESTPHGTG